MTPKKEMPLSASEIVELFKEAQTVVISLQHASGSQRSSKESSECDDPIDVIDINDSVTDIEKPLLDCELKVPARFVDKPIIDTPTPTVTESNDTSQRRMVKSVKPMERQFPNKPSTTGLKRSFSLNRKTRGEPPLKGTEVKKSLKRSSSFSYQPDAKRIASSNIKKSLNSSQIEKTNSVPENCIKKIQPLSTLKPVRKVPLMKQSLLQKPSSGLGQPLPVIRKPMRIKPPTLKGNGPLRAIKVPQPSVQQSDTTPAKGTPNRYDFIILMYILSFHEYTFHEYLAL